MPRSKKPLRIQAEELIAKLVARRDLLRQHLAEVEKELAGLHSTLQGARGAPPPVIVRNTVPDAEEPEGEPAELAEEDQMGEGRWIA